MSRAFCFWGISMRRIVFPLILGLGGIGVLLWLGFWQLQRLAWKEALIAGIEARIHDAPTELPVFPDPATDQYLPVTVTGHIGKPMLRVLSSQQFVGSGYRIISPMQVNDRTILLDRGFVAEDGTPRILLQDVTVTGNLLWPQETDSYTPPPDLTANIWFARDVPAMAKALGTEPVMIVAREGPDDSPISPAPVDTAGIPNNHKEYAITWFSLATAWAGMTVYLLWRIRQRTI
jgi:surfeit locus 1 family protein